MTVMLLVKSLYSTTVHQHDNKTGLSQVTSFVYKVCYAACTPQSVSRYLSYLIA